MESERLTRLRAAFEGVNAELFLAEAEVEELQNEEKALHQSVQDRVYVRNQLRATIQSLRAAIVNQESIERMEGDENVE